MNVGSLFSGIGGFDLGLERAGMRVVWQCEADPFCRAVLRKHWPAIPCHRDVRELTGAGPVDVLCGGFPCQDISAVGRRAGIDGKDSGLWSEFARLVGELRPRYVVVENVANLLVRGLDRVLGDLAALGYDAEWDCLPACAFGAPHRRDRLWLVAYPAGEQHEVGSHALGGKTAPHILADTNGGGFGAELGALLPGTVEPDAAGCGEGRRSAVDEGRPLDDPVRGRHGAPEGQVRPRRDGALGADGWAAEPDVGRVAHGIPARVDRLRSLGNSLVPQIAEWIGRRILEAERVGSHRGARS